MSTAGIIIFAIYLLYVVDKQNKKIYDLEIKINMLKDKLKEYTEDPEL